MKIMEISIKQPALSQFQILEVLIDGKPVVGVIYGRLFEFSRPTRVSQLLEQTAIDDRPKSMSSLLNYPA